MIIPMVMESFVKYPEPPCLWAFAGVGKYLFLQDGSISLISFNLNGGFVRDLFLCRLGGG